MVRVQVEHQAHLCPVACWGWRTWTSSSSSSTAGTAPRMRWAGLWLANSHFRATCVVGNRKFQALARTLPYTYQLSPIGRRGFDLPHARLCSPERAPQGAHRQQARRPAAAPGGSALGLSSSSCSCRAVRQRRQGGRQGWGRRHGGGGGRAGRQGGAGSVLGGRCGGGGGEGGSCVRCCCQQQRWCMGWWGPGNGAVHLLGPYRESRVSGNLAEAFGWRYAILIVAVARVGGGDYAHQPHLPSYELPRTWLVATTTVHVTDPNAPVPRSSHSRSARGGGGQRQQRRGHAGAHTDQPRSPRRNKQ